MITAVRRHLDEHGFADIEIVAREGEPAWWTPPDHPVVLAGGRAAEEVTGMAATSACRCPGTVPMFQVCAAAPRPGDLARAPAATTAGRTRPTRTSGSRTSATATRIMGRFLDAFARLPEVPRVP